jgi:hypothetical protein
MSIKIEAPKNVNYAATVVTLDQFRTIENSDNLKHAIVLGSSVIVSKDTKAGTRGLFFPVECQIATEFIMKNNLFRKKEMNLDNTKTGFFDENGRVRCIKLRGAASEGFFIPLHSLKYIMENPEELKDNTTFDKLNGYDICNKYVVYRKTQGAANTTKKNGKKVKKQSRLVDGQFRFHNDTSHLARNIFMVHPNTPLNITNKIHGSSFIVSNLLCKKKINPILRVLRTIGVPINDTEYGMIYSSRNVIKNEYITDGDSSDKGFYKEDIWKCVSDAIKPYVTPGMTVYGEVAGYLPTTGGAIQKNYDYGCNLTDTNHKYRIYVYRITMTDMVGNVHEFHPDMIKMWRNNIIKLDNSLEWQVNVVPEEFVGIANDIYPMEIIDVMNTNDEQEKLSLWRSALLDEIRARFNIEKDCDICINKVPKEGVVVRLMDRDSFPALKFKGFRFLEKETKSLDNGEVDIEEEN